MTIPIDPAGHRVIIKPDPVEEVSKGGIVLAHGADKKRKESGQHIGVLVKIGPTAWKAFDNGEPWAHVGDHVYFAKYGGYEIEHNGETYRVMNDEDVTAIIRSEAAA
jgi:chaperonin GroES